MSIPSHPLALQNGRDSHVRDLSFRPRHAGRRVEAGAGQAADAVGQGRVARRPAARVSAAADGPRGSGRTSTACGTTRSGRKDEAQPEKFDGQILVPFPVESALSGVRQAGRPRQRALVSPHVRGARSWQGRPAGAAALRRGRLGGDRLGQRQGARRAPGRLRSVQLRHHRRAEARGEQELVVAVWDPTDAGGQPRGKQVLQARRHLYTPVTGIWQTVWLEPVPADAHRRLKIVPDVDSQCVRVTVERAGRRRARRSPSTRRTRRRREVGVGQRASPARRSR